MNAIRGPIPAINGITIISGNAGSPDGKPPGKTHMLNEHLAGPARGVKVKYVHAGDAAGGRLDIALVEAVKEHAGIIVCGEARERPHPMNLRSMIRSALEKRRQVILVINEPGHPPRVEHHDGGPGVLRWEWKEGETASDLTLRRETQ